MATAFLALGVGYIKLILLSPTANSFLWRNEIARATEKDTGEKRKQQKSKAYGWGCALQALLPVVEFLKVRGEVETL